MHGSHLSWHKRAGVATLHMILSTNESGELCPQLEQVEVEAGQAEGEAETEAPGSPSVGQEPHTGGSGWGDSEIEKDRIQSGPISVVDLRPGLALISSIVGALRP